MVVVNTYHSIYRLFSKTSRISLQLVKLMDWINILCRMFLRREINKNKVLNQILRSEITDKYYSFIISTTIYIVIIFQAITW